MVQRISVRNVVFKTREVKPFIVCTHILGMGPDELLRRQKGKQQEKQATLKSKCQKKTSYFTESGGDD